MLDPSISGAVARAVTACGDHFASLPNGRLNSEIDLLSVIVLALQNVDENSPDPRVVAAKNRLVRLGFGNKIPLSYPDKLAIYALSYWKLSGFRSPSILEAIRTVSPVEPRESIRNCWSRCVSLWEKIESDQQKLSEDCLELATRLGQLLPEDLSLMPHQLEAVLMAERAGFKFLFEDDMGLGKTVEILATILLLGSDAFPLIIASPLSVSYKWEREVLKWLAFQNPEVIELKSSMSWDDAKHLKESGKNLVLRGSWQQLISNCNQILSLSPRSIVGDESHYMANWESQRTRAFLRIRSKTDCVLEATGTMMPNGRHREAYAQIKALNTNAFAYLGDPGRNLDGHPKGDWKLFARRYCDPKTTFLGEKTITTYDGRSNEVEFGALIAKYSIRRTKLEVFGSDGSNGLPPKTRYILPVPVSVRDRLRLASVRDSVKEHLQVKARSLQLDLESRGFPDAVIIDKVKKLLSSESVTQLSKMRMQVGLLKARWCAKRISELVEEGHRVVVFCEHYAVADKAFEVLSKSLGGRVLLGKGDLTGVARRKLIDLGQSGEGDVIILTRAYREGVDLVSYDWLVMLERWWVPGEEIQAEDRIHRIGQLLHVGIEYFMIPGTTDDAMTEVQVWKEAGQFQSAGSAEQRIYEWIMSEAA